MSISSILVPLLVYWLVLFVVCYTIVEFGQNYLYDETTPRMGLKVAAGSLLLAALLTWTRTTFDTMLTTDLPWSTLQAIAWFAVFTLIFQFQPLHGAVLGIVSMLVIAGLASIAVDSLTTPGPRVAPEVARPAQPVRRPTGPVPVPSPAAENPGAGTEPQPE